MLCSLKKGQNQILQQKVNYENTGKETRSVRLPNSVHDPSNLRAGDQGCCRSYNSCNRNANRFARSALQDFSTLGRN